MPKKPRMHERLAQGDRAKINEIKARLRLEEKARLELAKEKARGTMRSPTEVARLNREHPGWQTTSGAIMPEQRTAGFVRVHEPEKPAEKPKFDHIPSKGERFRQWFHERKSVGLISGLIRDIRRWLHPSQLDSSIAARQRMLHGKVIPMKRAVHPIDGMQQWTKAAVGKRKVA